MQVLDAFNAEFEGHNPSLLGASKTMYKCDASNVWNLAQVHSTERKDRVSGFLAKYMFRWLQVKAHSSDPAPEHLARKTNYTIDAFNSPRKLRLPHLTPLHCPSRSCCRTLLHTSQHWSTPRCHSQFIFCAKSHVAYCHYHHFYVGVCGVCGVSCGWEEVGGVWGVCGICGCSRGICQWGLDDGCEFDGFGTKVEWNI
jgi:hypothetical protein